MKFLSDYPAKEIHACEELNIKISIKAHTHGVNLNPYSLICMIRTRRKHKLL